MQLLNEILLKQKGASDNNLVSQHIGSDYQYLVRFGYCGSEFAVDITHIMEVVEDLNVTPFPEPVEGYLGVCNVRGRILPVLEPQFPGCCEKRSKVNKFRGLIVDFNDGEPFALIVSTVAKASVRRESINPGVTLNIKDTPVTYLDVETFKKCVGEPSDS